MSVTLTSRCWRAGVMGASALLIVGCSTASGQPPVSSLSMDPSQPVTPTSPAADGAAVTSESTPPEPPPLIPFADAAGVQLMPLAPKVEGYAYHESLFPTALSLSPHGHATKVDNPRFSRLKRSVGPDYVVMASRGRDSGPTTGVDIVLDEGTTVVAPVNGEVVDASAYKLYCETPDRRLIIRPSDHPDDRVVLFHLTDVQVNRGDVVEAGVTPLGRPRVFSPHSAQYDAYIAGGHPHVHLEVEGEPTEPLPGCPIGRS